MVSHDFCKDPSYVQGEWIVCGKDSIMQEVQQPFGNYAGFTHLLEDINKHLTESDWSIIFNKSVRKKPLTAVLFLKGEFESWKNEGKKKMRPMQNDNYLVISRALSRWDTAR